MRGNLLIYGSLSPVSKLVKRRKLVELPEIEALLKSKQTEDRLRAVRLLSRNWTLEAQKLLVKTLEDKSNYVASLAAEALSACTDLTICAGMAARFLYIAEDGLKRDPGCHIRSHIAAAFGKIEFYGATDALRSGIRTIQIEPVAGVPFDTAAHLRANCALALAQLLVPDVLIDISRLLFDRGNNAVGSKEDGPKLTIEPRKAAAQALARLADAGAIVPLALKLTFPGDEEIEVLQECMQAVVDREESCALDLLTPYLRHYDPHLAAYAILMIARTRTPEAPGLIRGAIERLHGDPLEAAVLALVSIRDEQSRDVLYEMMSDLREEVRLNIANALSGTIESADRAHLEAMAKLDGSPKVRAAAQRALQG